MHRLQDGALNPEFSMSQLQTYIKVCRTLKPQFTKESAEILRDEYKKLRQQSSNKQAGAQSSYRYTVRQLESLIRLSEAMARAHAETVIRPVYVKEVCRLLKDSNVSILKSDLEFEENQDIMNQESQARQQMEMQQVPQVNNSNDLFVSQKIPYTIISKRF